MEYSPPPLFKQGASARAKVALFAFMSLALLVADARLHALTVLRQGVGTVLYPLQVAALWPRNAVYAVGDYFESLSSVQHENKNLRRQQVANAQTLQQAQQLAAENAHLRRLLGASEKLPLKSLMSEILYDTRDAFTRKIVLDRGSHNGVATGQPVIDDTGVVGQVTRVFPFMSEVTLLTDKDQAIPVQVVRSGLRSVAYGLGQSGVLDLRFMPTNADIRKDDMLVTSGIDGVYPPGLAVARVTQVDNKSSDAFARIHSQPVAGINRNRQLLVLLADTTLPVRPVDEDRDGKLRKDKKRADGSAPAKELPTKGQPVAPAMPPKNAAAPAAAGKPAPTAAEPAHAAAGIPAAAATHKPTEAKGKTR